MMTLTLSQLASIPFWVSGLIACAISVTIVADHIKGSKHRDMSRQGVFVLIIGLLLWLLAAWMWRR
jgi:hypothetical protein